MTKQQVLTTLNEKLAKRNFKATIVHFDKILEHCEVLITTKGKHSYIVATMAISFDYNQFLIYGACICNLPNQFVDAYNLIQREEIK